MFVDQTRPVRVSVVLPVLDEEDCIDDALSRLRSQTFTDLEILVADGRSSDATRDIVAHHARLDDRVRLVDNPRRLQSAGLNAALDEARGEILVRVDGHSFVEADYVEKCVEILGRTGADVVGGRMCARPVDENVAQGIAVANEARWGAGPAQFHRDGTAGPTDTVYLGSFVTETVRALDGWAEDVGVNEDYELNHRIRQAGGTVWFDPALSVGYQPRRTLRAVAKQYFRYGRSKATVMRRHPSSIRVRQFVPTAIAPAGVVAATGLGGRGAWGSLARLSRFAIALHLGAVVVAALTTTRSVSLAAPSAAAAWLMHWAWSAGFWYGTIRPFPPASQYQTRPPRS